MRWITCLACTRSHLLPYEDPEWKQLLAVRIIHCSLLRFCSRLMLYYLTLVFLYIHFFPIYSYIFIVCNSGLPKDTSLKYVMFFTSQSWKAEAFGNHSHHFKCHLINKEWDDGEEPRGICV